jgi:hypothetical protein
MNRIIKTRHKEYMRHICLGQPEKSAPAKYRFKTGHNIGFSSSAVVGKTPS